MKGFFAKIKELFSKHSFLKWLAPLVAVILVATTALVPVLAGCGRENITSNGVGNSSSENEITKLSFKSAAEYEYLKTLDGTTVAISGYIATSSPVDGSFMFLMNLPYQSCPFCVPNTSQLSNTMEVYPKKGDKFDYTTQAIKVVGTLEVADNEDEPFTDKYGYEFNYKIVDATYTILKSEDMSADLALWQKIAESDVINDIYAMYDYVNFTCAWNTYFVNSYMDEEGVLQPGYYLWAVDAEKYLFTEGAQWNYGYKEGYFDNIIKKIQSVDETAFADLVENVKKAQALATKAIQELTEKNYTVKYQYVERFDTMDYIYTLDKGEELQAEMKAIYLEFSNWLGSWEM
jgi:predicted transcriptional regulator